MNQVTFMVVLHSDPNIHFVKKMEMPFACIGMNVELQVRRDTVPVQVSACSWAQGEEEVIVQIDLGKEEENAYRFLFETDSSWERTPPRVQKG